MNRKPIAFLGEGNRQYEQGGKDRASYGENLIEALAKALSEQKVPGCAARRLWEYRQFYQSYPEILRAATAELHSNKFYRTVKISAFCAK